MAVRFALTGKVIWFYLGKLVWPEPLVFIHPRWGSLEIALQNRPDSTVTRGIRAPLEAADARRPPR